MYRPATLFQPSFLSKMVNSSELPFPSGQLQVAIDASLSEMANKVAGTDFVCLHIVGPTAQVWCRWETDANRYQVAAALERMAERLRSAPV